MKNCPSEKILFDFLEGSQPSDASLRIKKHLDVCAACRSQYNELLKAQTLLIQRRRPEPSGKILLSYHQNLKQAFAPVTMWIRIKNHLEYGYNLLIHSRPLSIRLARGMALLLIGIFIGKIIFQPIGQQSREKPSIIMLTMSPTDVRFMTDYMTQSEIWLLAVANIPSAQKIEKSDLLFNKEVAQRLLIKTTFMEERKQQIDSELFTKFLNHFELLLLEIANASDERMVDISTEIKVMIENSSLLYETRLLREMFETASAGI